MVGGPTNRGYVITVKGVLGPAARAVFADTEVSVVNDATELRDADADQATLFGLLGRVQDLGLEVLEVRQVPSGRAAP
jgi:hypothetical protein